MIKITKKRKNPHLEDISQFIRKNSNEFYKIGQGAEGVVFYFKLNKSLILNTKILKPNEYILKIYDFGGNLSLKKIKKLLIYSKYGLIPKIYVITNKYIVSKYIDGYSLNYVLAHFPNSYDNIYYKIDKLKEIWNKLGFNHDDLKAENILFSKDLKSVYFIDPYIEFDDD